MTVSLLNSVGFTWVKHPHRLHTMTIAEDLTGGIEVTGGPWTTGKRSSDSIVSHTRWQSVPGLSARVHALPNRQGEGHFGAEVRWLLAETTTSAVAVVGMKVSSLSHAAGFNVSDFAVGVDPADTPRRAAWVKLGAARVPDRPERFDRVVLDAELTIAELSTVNPDNSVVIENAVAESKTGGGFRPTHDATEFSPLDGDGEIMGLAGWSFSVTNTPRARGRYLKTWRTGLTSDGSAEMLVSNRGEVTRSSELALGASLVRLTRG